MAPDHDQNVPKTFPKERLEALVTSRRPVRLGRFNRNTQRENCETSLNKEEQKYCASGWSKRGLSWKIVGMTTSARGENEPLLKQIIFGCPFTHTDSGDEPGLSGGPWESY